MERILEMTQQHPDAGAALLWDLPKSLQFSEPQFFHLLKGNKTSLLLSSQGSCECQMRENNVYESVCKL